VSQRLMGEVPMGIVLSGGLDSSLVAAVAHEAAQRAGQPVPDCGRK
jgi:asparagine synthetase B (glutamine-hydrolysing)